MPVKPKGVVLAEFVAEGTRCQSEVKKRPFRMDAQTPQAEPSNKRKPSTAI